MAISALRFGRWSAIGVLSAVTVAACGGRDNLSTGWEEYEGVDAGTTSGGSLAGSGGSSAGRGGKAMGGSGGKMGGAGGAGGVTMGGSSAGAGGGAVCKPGSTSCDASGTTLLTCTTNGQGYLPTTCMPGQRCIEGACQTPVCTPAQAYCSDNALYLCNDQGTGGILKLRCDADQYCDDEQRACQPYLCRANQPVCNGDVATFCDGSGTSYLPGGQDCSLYPGERCRAGTCSCNPTLANCNGIELDGCEINLVGDANNCGDCGVVCSANHMSTRTCNGACNGTCQTGFADCDGDKQGDGCETAVGADASNCGGCGIVCSTNNVTAACSAGQCTGKCLGRFRDCNGDKQSDGCEIDTRSDVEHCGGCGLLCSDNHVAPKCTGSKCAGACDAGFADCNKNKQSDGCEVDTQSDSSNCGACGTVCDAGTSCRDGKCSALFTFKGILRDTPSATLVGWSECFSSYYGEDVALADVLDACIGNKLMMACRVAGSDTLQLAAYANRQDVLFDTGDSDTTHAANGVGWYFSKSRSWGFAPEGAAVHRYSCDIVASQLEMSGVGADERLCWHTQPEIVAGGWRCGADDTLNGSFQFERVLFTAP